MNDDPYIIIHISGGLISHVKMSDGSQVPPIEIRDYDTEGLSIAEMEADESIEHDDFGTCFVYGV